jgi:hypothetical protein
MTNSISPISMSGSVVAPSVTDSDNLPYTTSHIRNSTSEEVILHTEHSTISIDELSRLAIEEHKVTFNNHNTPENISPNEDRMLDDGRHKMVS